MRGQRFYRNKPYVPVRINRDHPYAKHLIFAIDPLQGELAHRNGVNYVSGYSKVATAGGAAYTTTTAQYGEVSDHSGIQNTGELFIYAVVAGNGVASIHKTATDGLTNSEFDLWCNLDYSSNTFHFGRANTADRWWRGNIPVAANTINVFSVSAQSAMEAAVTAGLNGSSVTMSTDGTGTGANNLSGNPIRINRRNGSTSSNTGTLLFAAAFRRNLGEAAHALLGNNPYDIVEPIRKIFTFYSVGTTATTLARDIVTGSSAAQKSAPGSATARDIVTASASASKGVTATAAAIDVAQGNTTASKMMLDGASARDIFIGQSVAAPAGVIYGNAITRRIVISSAQCTKSVAAATSAKDYAISSSVSAKAASSSVISRSLARAVSFSAKNISSAFVGRNIIRGAASTGGAIVIPRVGISNVTGYVGISNTSGYVGITTIQ